MPKEIDESKLNYNKYPGEHVVEFEGVVTIGKDKTFHLVQNFREGFNATALEQRFSDVFDKYDYIVGDWGFEQLRLKGFFSTSRRKMDAASKIDHLEDYLNEYCNFGAPYFVLRRIRTRDLKKEAYTAERALDENNRQPKFDKPRRKRPRNRNKNRDNAENTENTTYEIRPKKADFTAAKDNNKPKKQGNRKKSDTRDNFKIKQVSNKDNKQDKPNKASKPEKNNTPKQGFVIRTRDKK